MHVDDSSNIIASGVGLSLISPEGVEVKYALRFDFSATNNEAEYEVLLASLAIARMMGANGVRARSDSQLVVNQVLGDYITKEEEMREYLAQIETLRKAFNKFELTLVLRNRMNGMSG